MTKVPVNGIRPLPEANELLQLLKGVLIATQGVQFLGAADHKIDFLWETAKRSAKCLFRFLMASESRQRIAKNGGFFWPKLTSASYVVNDLNQFSCVVVCNGQHYAQQCVQ